MYSSDDDDFRLVRSGSVRDLTKLFDTPSTWGNRPMSSSYHGSKLFRYDSVNDLTERNRLSRGSNENKPAKPPVKPRSKKSPASNPTKKERKQISQDVFSVIFEKPVGKIQDFKLCYRTNSRGTTGLFIQNVQPRSSVSGLLEAKDQLIKVNDLDVQNLDRDKVDDILENLSGTITLKVVRINLNPKRHEDNAKKGAESARQESNTASATETKITQKEYKEGINSEQGVIPADKQPKKELEPENFEELAHKECNDVPTKTRLADDKKILTPKSDQNVTTKVEHPYVDKTEFQRLQDNNVDLAQQLQITKEENSSLQSITQNDKTAINSEQGLKTADLTPNKELENVKENVMELLHKEHNDVPTKIRLADDKNILTSKSDQNVTTTGEHPYVDKTEFQRLQDDHFDLTQQLQKTKKENSSLQVIIKLLQEDKTRLAQFQPFSRMRTAPVQQGLQLENVALRNKVQNLQHEKDKKSNELQSEMQKLQQEDNSKKTEIFQLQQEKDDMSNEMVKLRLENNKIKVDIQQLREEDNNKKNEISQLQKEKNETSNEMRQFRQENDNIKTEIQQLRQEENKLRSQMQQLRQENNNLKVGIQKLQQEKYEKSNKMRQLQKENNNIKINMQELQQQDNYLRIAMQQLQKNNHDMITEMQQLRQENNNFKIENRHLQESTECSFLIEKGSVNISEKVLGEGAYGAVYKGNFYGTEVAVKEYHEIIVSSYNTRMLKREINIASQCRHPNLLQFICATKNDKNRLLIVTELMDMALRTLIEQHGMYELQLVDEEAKLISMDVARGLSYLHSITPNPIIHRDVSSANVLLSIDKSCAVIKAKISDYGSANFTKACKTANPGAAIYAAPEASKTQHDRKLDVYSYGCLICEIYICEQPDPIQRERQIAKIPNRETKKIVEQCTAINPRERPTMQDVIGFWEKI